MVSPKDSVCVSARNHPDERLIFENTTDAIIVLQDGILRYVNANGIRLMGYCHEELLDRHFRDFVHPDDLPMVELRYQQRMQYEPVPEVYPFRLITRRGEALWFEIHAIEMTWKGQRASLTFFHNIQRRVLAEEALSRNAERTRALLNAIPDMMLRLNLDGFCLNHKPFEEARHFTILTPVEGKRLQEFCPEPIAGICMEAMKRAVSTREMQIFEFPCDCQETRTCYEVRVIALVRDEILLIVRDISDRKRMEETLRQREENLRKENVRLRSSMRERYGFRNLIGKSPAMQAVYDHILRASASNAHVILYGESGTGKELVARAIHDLSDRAMEPFIPVNCGAIPPGLMESEFFGYKKGAFSGAVSDRRGYLDMACKGTLFMDELGEIDTNMQVKLLRAIEGGGFMPVGGDRLHKPDLRIIGATNRNLMDLVRKRMMREDFFYRINIIPIHLPPLRERGEDLNLLIYHFLEALSEKEPAPVIPSSILAMLRAYSWPGNVRELQNVIQRYLTMDSIDLAGKGEGAFYEPAALSRREVQDEGLDLKRAVENFERSYIERMLKRNRWKREETAKILGIHRKTLFRKMRDLGLEE